MTYAIIKLTEISEVAHLWLTASGNKVDRQFLKTEMFSHPDYPALTSLTDILDAGNFDYTARRASFKEIDEFTYPCIINVALPNGNAGLHYVVNKDAFNIAKDYWNGIILYAGERAGWKHPENDIQLKAGQKKVWATAAIFSSILLLSSFISLFSNYGLFFLLRIITSALGFITGTLLIGQELGLSTQLVQKVCGIGGKQSGCPVALINKSVFDLPTIICPKPFVWNVAWSLMKQRGWLCRLPIWPNVESCASKSGNVCLT